MLRESAQILGEGKEQFVSPGFMPCRSFRGTIYVCQMV